MEGILGRVIATVLGLIALAGVVFVGNQALSGSKVSGLQTDVAQMVNNARAGFATSNGYGNFTIPVAATAAQTAPFVNSGILPPSLVRNGLMTDPWGNRMAVVPQANNQRFAVTLGGPGVTREQCAALLTGMQGYSAIAVGTLPTTTEWAPVAPAAGTGVWSSRTPPDSVGAGTACDIDGRVIHVQFQ